MANEKMNAKEAQSPIKGQFPDKEKIICKDCIFRDKTLVEIGNKKIPVGATKSFCEKYEAPPKKQMESLTMFCLMVGIANSTPKRNSNF